MIMHLVKALVLIYLVVLSIQLYSVAFPSSCQHEKSLNQGGAFQKVILSNYQKSCLAPAWTIEDSLFDVSLDVGNKEIVKDVWTKSGISIKTAMRERISFSLPINATILTRQSLSGWFRFSLSPSSVSANHVRPFILKVSLGEKRAINRDPRVRNLLDLEDERTRVNPSDYVGGDDVHALHFKHMYYPINVRFANMFLTVDPATMRSLGISLNTKTPKIVPTAENRLTDLLYSPLLWIDDLSMTQGHYIPLQKPSTDTLILSFDFDYAPTSFFTFWCKNMLRSTLDALKQTGVLNESIIDELKAWLSEDRLYIMFVTQIVAWLHLAFEFLAFRNDYQFFKGRKSYKGISASSLIFGFGRSVVLFLYLHDSGTSWIVLLTILKDIIYDAWKLKKVLRPTILLEYNGSWFPFCIKLRDLSACGDFGEKETARYDSIAISHGSLCLYPLVVGFGLYYLKTYAYKSWYSWIISTLVDCTYMFGFLSLVPQVYINYKLKSVAHLPMRAFMYKIFNTFVDDIFAFIVKMPLKHKIMTLRDDAIFLIFLYQWWIYPADKSRSNEFGFQYDEDSKILEDTLTLLAASNLEGENSVQQNSCSDRGKSLTVSIPPPSE